VEKPYLTTFHGNINSAFTFDSNTVFISHNQAARYHGSTVVYNGLDWSNYPAANLGLKRDHFHFLGDASWKVKNVRGATAIARKAGEKLVVIGGRRVNFNMGFRFTPDLHVRFKGNTGDQEKGRILSTSKGLLFPVLWHEPFGLAIIESMYFGCPVFGTRFGSLPELVTAATGFLSNSETELAYALKNAGDFSAVACHEYASLGFNATVMTNNYLALYEKILNGETLHDTNPFLPEDEIIPVKRFAMDV
jgi:glycosyltransferase involved in cell wall biosynthesis